MIDRGSWLDAMFLAALLVCLGSIPGWAQSGPQPDLNQLALQWARGSYASPVHCEFSGVARRGIRRVAVTPGLEQRIPAVGRILFADLEASEASRCFTELEPSVPNVTGSLEIRLPGASRRDTARRDLSATLRREGGFEFDIVSGRLAFQQVGPQPPPAQRIDFSGGKARLHRVRRGSDDARLLSEFPGPRKLTLELSATGGESLRLLLFLAPGP